MVSIVPTDSLRFGGDCRSSYSSSCQPRGSGSSGGDTAVPAAAAAAAEDPMNFSKTSHHRLQHHPQKMQPLQHQQESISSLSRSLFSKEEEEEEQEVRRFQHHRPRHVSFNYVLETVHIQPLHQLNEDDRSAVFLTREDYARIRQELKDGIRARMIIHDQHRQQKKDRATNDPLYREDFDFSMRGLETKSAQDQRRSNQRQARMAVLNEQSLQRSRNESIPEVIAMLYNVLTLPSQQHAFQLAIEDAASVIRNNEKKTKNIKENHHTQTANCDNQVLYGDQQSYTQDFEATSSSSSASSSDDGDIDDSMKLCEDVVFQLAKLHNPPISVEDWLLGRFNCGRLMADAVRRDQQALVVCQKDHHRPSSVDATSNISSKRQRYDDRGDIGEHSRIRPISPPIFPIMGWSDIFLQQDEEMDFHFFS